MHLPLTYEQIVKILPHRYPFLLVDKIVELELNKRVVGIKNVTANEPFFQGHFPDNPIMPGVLVIEAMAQVGGILARLSVPETLEGRKSDSIFFASILVRFTFFAVWLPDLTDPAIHQAYNMRVADCVKTDVRVPAGAAYFFGFLAPFPGHLHPFPYCRQYGQMSSS